jgi:hypothetical protein
MEYHSAPARRQERLGDDVEHLIGPGTHQDLRRVDTDIGRRGFRNVDVHAVRVFVERRVEWPRERGRKTRQGQGRGVQVEAQDVRRSQAVTGGEHLA